MPTPTEIMAMEADGRRRVKRLKRGDYTIEDSSYALDALMRYLNSLSVEYKQLSDLYGKTGKGLTPTSANDLADFVEMMLDKQASHNTNEG